MACAAARWYTATISRHSSGSSRAEISVEPTRSQKSTVRCRRSPPAAPITGAVSLAVAGAESPNAEPQSPQNLSPGWLVAPHFGHGLTSGAPHLVQYFRPARLSLAHFEQRIPSPLRLRGADEREPPAPRDHV